MSREARKLQKFFNERARRELRKANKYLAKGEEPAPPRERIDLRWLDEDGVEVEDRAAVKKRSHVDRERDPIALSEGWAVEIRPGYCDLSSAGERIRCRSGGEVAIGDRVLFSTERRRIQEVLPRRTALSRPDPANPRVERVIAANVDVVVNVVSVRSPPLRPGLIDRYLIAIGKSGAEPLVCVNKIDLVESAADLEPLEPYREAGVPLLCCSAATGEGIATLGDALAGRLCVFAGHSGVGKSSLLNALLPDLKLATGAVSEANEKGRHTTTSSSLHQLANGAMVIDTPGIREFGLWAVSREDVRGYYREFDGWECAFADCSHVHEPDCGVKRAVEAGEISGERYRGYLRVWESLR